MLTVIFVLAVILALPVFMKWGLIILGAVFRVLSYIGVLLIILAYCTMQGSEHSTPQHIENASSYQDI